MNKIYYGLINTFTNRTDDSEIILKTGAGEIFSSPNVLITNATISSLNVGSLSSSVINSATIGTLFTNNSKFTNSTVSRLIAPNSLITNSTISNLNCSVGTITSLNTSTAIITNSTETNTILSNAILTTSSITNLNVSVSSIGSLINSSGTFGSLRLTDRLVSSSYATFVQPALYCSGSGSNVVMGTSSTFTVLDQSFWATRSTYGSMTFDSSGNITVPISGFYLINLQVGFLTGNSVNLQTGISLSGTPIATTWRRSDLGLTGTVNNVNTFLYLSTGVNYNTFISHQSSIASVSAVAEPKVSRLMIYKLI